MFGSRHQNELSCEKRLSDALKEVSRLSECFKEANAEHSRRTQDLQAAHVLAMREKDFEMKHFKDEELKKLFDKVSLLERELAVSKEKNVMLDKLVDLNADIIDVKGLVSKLIEKLPQINLQNLTVNAKSEQGK